MGSGTSNVSAWAQTAPSKSAPARIVILGDSITAGYGVPRDQAFPAVLQRKISEAALPFEVVAAGVSGDTTAGGLRRIAWALGPGAAVCIIALGGNDGLRGVPPEQTEANLTAIIQAVRNKNPQTQIVLAGMQMPENLGAAFVKNLTHHADSALPPMRTQKGISYQFITGQYYEMSPTEYREFVYEARVSAGQTLRLQAYRAIPDEPGEEGGIFHGLCAVVEWVEIEGPLLDQWPPRGHQFLYGDLPLVPLDVKQPQKELIVTSASPEADARRLLGGFLTKIFRRAATIDEVEEHVGIFKEHLQSGMRFDEALRMAYKMALCSPEFLFFAEHPGRLSDNALGTRLSYALWGGPPDAALAEVAAQGKLHEPGVLREQTDRLLADPRSNRFVRSFLDSWLNLRDINATQPDTKLFTEFEDYLRDSMVDESVAFFGELVRENLGVKNVVHSDFAMLNERLAEHYGIPGVRGVGIRKVALPEHSRRGGLLTQGAVLKVSANGTSTSPVVRGAYVLARFLGTPPEPPPKSVPAIEPDIRGATTIRDQLEKHRADATCATCHATLDPPGFALESFDVTGRWRTNYRTLPESAKGRVVTIAGCDARLFAEGPKVLPGYTLEDGRVFEDIDGFKRLLLSNQEQLARALTEKLVAHFTGARMQFADREVVSDIVKRAQKDGYGVRSLIHEVIQSRLFREK